MLQTRGRMTAQAIADELEVSVRTVYRDVESLGAAGVPIYADRGPTGGYQLLDGYRTRLTGMTSDEAGSLYLAAMPGPAAELGLGSVLAAAQLKLRASLPGELAERADRVRERFYLDAPGWFRADEPTPYLSAVADAVWSGRQMEIRYRRWKAPREVTRTLDPLGVVLKAGRWYLVAGSGTRTTTYRVTNILSASLLSTPVVRPDGFDLAAFWREWTSRYEQSVYRLSATVRMTAAALERMAFVFPPEMSRQARAAASPPDSSGWLVTTVPIESVRHGHIELLKLGDAAEVLAPPELRALFARTARGLAALYSDLPDERGYFMTMPDDQLAYNRQLIAEFRADGGASMGNRPLLLLTTRGRRSGAERTSPMMYVRAASDDRLLVIASNAGAAQHPAWYLNLTATPEVTVELPGSRFSAAAAPLTGADYDREWSIIKEKFPFFAEHEQKAAGRRIPVVALTPEG
ncbi:nitroreductase/quinone reductase family protein [Actinoplanes sp. NPDC051343]|uniref:nitroreductase/quinone reductase family protein n=1 Tax=Actinoplanes sp. NPDC051343 TaxID=3363906 RepID=UPI00378C1C17